MLHQWHAGRKRLAARVHHGGMWKEEVSERMLHQRCNALGFRWRDVAGEMLHHGGLRKE